MKQNVRNTIHCNQPRQPTIDNVTAFTRLRCRSDKMVPQTGIEPMQIVLQTNTLPLSYQGIQQRDSRMTVAVHPVTSDSFS